MLIYIACGDPDFTATIRRTVISLSNAKRIISFFEPDFKPWVVKGEAEHGTSYPEMGTRLKKKHS